MSLRVNLWKLCPRASLLQRAQNQSGTTHMPFIWDQDMWDSPTAFWSDNPSVPAPGTKRKAREGLTTTSYVSTGATLAAALAAKRTDITNKKTDISGAKSALEMEENALLALEGGLDDLLLSTCSAAQDAVNGDRDKMEEMNIPLRKIGTPSTRS